MKVIIVKNSWWKICTTI